MAITVSGTTITFNDATTQTTAAAAAPTAGNGITVTSGVIALGNPSNSSVGTYTAAIANIAGSGGGTDYTIGTTIAGSDLRITVLGAGVDMVATGFSIKGFNVGQVLTSAGLSGTWKSVTRSRGYKDYNCETQIPPGLWIRTV